MIMTSVLFAQQETDSTLQKGSLVVSMINIPSDEGMIMVALCNTKEDYETKGSAFRGKSASIKGGKSEIIFEYIPYGEYAVKVYHDEDEDTELDTNFLGSPAEAYGFSNNAEGSFGPAAWEDARFLFSTAIDSIEIDLD